MLRVAALSLLILVSLVVMLPAGDSSAHHTGRAAASRRSNMNRRHSRAWWRRYRARLRRRAALRRRQAQLRPHRGQNLNTMAESHKKSAQPGKVSTVSVSKNAVGGWNFALPNGWSRRAATGGAMKFSVSAADGRSVGEATLAIAHVQATGEVALTAKAQRRMLAGVPFTELRRTVIDKMIAEGGWVVNDLQREVGGRPVFIVLAQTAASSDGRAPQQSWVFYFTEVEGRIYTLAASSPTEFAARMADEAAQLVASFHANRSMFTGMSLR